MVNAAAADRSTPCAETDSELAGDEVRVERREPSGGDGVALIACGLVDAPSASVWPVLRDCERYQSFLPGVTRSELLSRSDGVARCKVDIDLPFPLSELRSVTRVEESELPNGVFRRAWELEEGNYRRNRGSWTLRPWGEGAQRTLAIYEVDLELGYPVPDFLLWRAQSATAPRVFDAIRGKVKEDLAE